jgi:hypothetical protein
MRSVVPRSARRDRSSSSTSPPFGVEVAGRFVGQDHFGIVDEAAGDGHALLFAAGKLVGPVLEPFAEPDALQQFLRLGLCLRRRHAGHAGGQGGVFHGIQFGQQTVRLKDEAEPAVAEFGQGSGRQLAEILASRPDIARVRPVQAAEQVQQRALARAARAAQCDEFAAPGGEVDPTQHVEGAAAQASKRTSGCRWR